MRSELATMDVPIQHTSFGRHVCMSGTIVSKHGVIKFLFFYFWIFFGDFLVLIFFE